MAKVWVKGYTKSDGTKVEGHYREISRSSQGKSLVQKGRRLEVSRKRLDNANADIKLFAPIMKKIRKNVFKRRAFSRSTGYSVKLGM